MNEISHFQAATRHGGFAAPWKLPPPDQPFLPEKEELLARWKQTYGEIAGHILRLPTLRFSSQEHGEDHWKKVAYVGAHLAQHQPEADPLVLFLFALLHDAARLVDDDDDPEHGVRSAYLARHLFERGRGPLKDSITLQQRSLLLAAIACHDVGEVSSDPSIGCCYDADRLNLWRGGIEPVTSFLSTPVGRDPLCIAWAREVQHLHLEWDDIYTLYAVLQVARHQPGSSARLPQPRGKSPRRVREANLRRARRSSLIGKRPGVPPVELI